MVATLARLLAEPSMAWLRLRNTILSKIMSARLSSTKLETRNSKLETRAIRLLDCIAYIESRRGNDSLDST